MSEVFEKENIIGLPNLRLDHYSTEPGNKETAFRGLGDSHPQLLHSDKLSISVKPLVKTLRSDNEFLVQETLRYLLLT